MFKNKKFFYVLLLIISFSFSMNINAQNIEQIHMKSGSVLEGYISEQMPGKFIAIQSVKAIIVVNSDSLKSQTINYLSFSHLPKEWKKWAEENERLILNNDGEKQLKLSSLQFNNTKYSNVYILEKGSLIKFLDLSPNEFRFNWNDMYRTVKTKRPLNLFSGVQETIFLKDGRKFIGQIIEQYPGRDIKIEDLKGDILSFKFSQVKKIVSSKILENSDLWSQIQFLDKLYLKNESEPIIGFISSRTLGDELLFEFEDGRKRLISLNIVKSYGKIPNKNYIAVYDRILDEGDILLNGDSICFEQLHNYGDYLLLSENFSTQITKGRLVTILANITNNAQIILVKAHMEKIPISTKKKKSRYNYPVISYQDLIKSPLPVVREYTPLGNVKISFTINEVGLYVLYIQGKDGYVVINVTE